MSRSFATPQSESNRRWRWFLVLVVLWALIALSCQILEEHELRFLEAIYWGGDLYYAQDVQRELKVLAFLRLWGIYTPTTPGSSPSLRLPLAGAGGVDVPTLEQSGFIAIRVPHAPPTFTVSSITTMTVQFTYRQPPGAPNVTTVPIAVTRRTEYEAMVNARFPITDGRSHWEVWWLPPGGQFPIPTQPFELQFWDPPLRVEYKIDFGAGADARACGGCVLEYQLYNGHVFMGTTRNMRISGATANALVLFDRCGAPTLMTAITPTVAFTHTHCLSNHDLVARTFDLQFSSSRNWNYTYFTQRTEPGYPLQALAGNQVTLDPSTGVEGLHIYAVTTPPITNEDAVRETFMITATSTVSPSVQATGVSWSIPPAYSLNEGIWRLLLPLIWR
jgi:hypothetical protein